LELTVFFETHRRHPALDNNLPLGNLRLLSLVAIAARDAIPSAIINNWNTTLVDMAGSKIVTSRNVTDLYSDHRPIETSR
jgi:hypothetical protein